MKFISYFRSHELEKKRFSLHFGKFLYYIPGKRLILKWLQIFPFNFITFSQKEFEIVSDMKRLFRKTTAKDKRAHLQLSLFVVVGGTFCLNTREFVTFAVFAC